MDEACDYRLTHSLIIRSLPVATVSLNITNQSVTKIDPQVKSCTVNNISTTWSLHAYHCKNISFIPHCSFDFEVCGNFSGKGLSTIGTVA